MAEDTFSGSFGSSSVVIAPSESLRKAEVVGLNGLLVRFAHTENLLRLLKPGGLGLAVANTNLQNEA